MAKSTYHTSLKSSIEKMPPPEARPIYSESSQHGDYKNNFGFGLACSVMVTRTRFKYSES